MPFCPPESPLNRIELAMQQAGYGVTIGTDYTVRPFSWVVWVGDEEVVCAPDVEQLAVIVEKWLEEEQGR